MQQAGISPFMSFFFFASPSPCFPFSRCYLFSLLQKEKSCSHSGKDHKVGHFENRVKMHWQRKMRSIKSGVGRKEGRKEKLVFSAHGEVEFRGEAAQVRLTSKQSMQRLRFSPAPGLWTRQRRGMLQAMEKLPLHNTVNHFVHHTPKHVRWYIILVLMHWTPIRQIRLHNIVRTRLQNSQEKLHEVWWYMNSKHELKRPLLVNILSECFCFFMRSKRVLERCSRGIEMPTIKGRRGSTVVTE